MPRRRGRRISRNPAQVRIQALPEPYQKGVSDGNYTYAQAIEMIKNDLSENAPVLLTEVNVGRMTYKEAYEQMETARAIDSTGQAQTRRYNNNMLKIYDEQSNTKLQQNFLQYMKQFYRAWNNGMNVEGLTRGLIPKSNNPDQQIYIRLSAMYKNVYHHGSNLYLKSKNELEELQQFGDPRKLFEALFSYKSRLCWENNLVINANLIDTDDHDHNMQHILQHNFIKLQQDSNIDLVERYEIVGGKEHVEKLERSLRDMVERQILLNKKTKESPLNKFGIPESNIYHHERKKSLEPPNQLSWGKTYVPSLNISNEAVEDTLLDRYLVLAVGNGVVCSEPSVTSIGCDATDSLINANGVIEKKEVDVISQTGLRTQLYIKIIKAYEAKYNNGNAFPRDWFYSYPYPNVTDFEYEKTITTDITIKRQILIRNPSKYFFLTNRIAQEKKAPQLPRVITIGGGQYHLASLAAATSGNGGHFISKWYDGEENIKLNSLGGVSTNVPRRRKKARGRRMLSNRSLSEQNFWTVAVYAKAEHIDKQLYIKVKTKGICMEQNTNQCFLNAGLNTLAIIKPFTRLPVTEEPLVVSNGFNDKLFFTSYFNDHKLNFDLRVEKTALQGLFETDKLKNLLEFYDGLGTNVMFSFSTIRNHMPVIIPGSKLEEDYIIIDSVEQDPPREPLPYQIPWLNFRQITKKDYGIELTRILYNLINEGNQNRTPFFLLYARW